MSERSTRAVPIGITATIASVTLMGIGSVVAKASEIAGPILALHRAWVAAVLYLGLFLAIGGRIKLDALRASAPGGLFFGVELGLFFSSIQLTTVANATMLLAMQPVAVLLFFSRRFGEVVTRREIALSIVAVLGVGLVVFGSTGSPSWSLGGDLLGVGALAAWTFYFVYSKEARRTTGAVEYQGLSLVFSSMVMLPVAAVFSGTLDPGPSNWWWIAAMVAIPGTGHLLLNWAHPRVPLTLVSQLTLFSPVVSVAVAALVLDGESVNAAQVVGMVTVLAALAALVRGPASPETRRPIMPDTPDTLAGRSAAVSEAIADIRAIEADLGVSREALDNIRERLVRLSSRHDLFSLAHFPAPPIDAADDSYVYRLSQDDDDRFALYVQATNGLVETKPHNHTTWACIVGLVGEERNQFYARTDDGLVETDATIVERGTGVTMLPDDVHAIRIDGEALMFHCYGLALERLVDRELYDAATGTWVNNAGPRNIVEARSAG